jgi:hypothetical protein
MALINIAAKCRTLLLSRMHMHGAKYWHPHSIMVKKMETNRTTRKSAVYPKGTWRTRISKNIRHRNGICTID